MYVLRFIGRYISSPPPTADRMFYVQIIFNVFRLFLSTSMSSPPRSRLTIILVNNLHCPSCTTNVEDTLSALQPPPFSISTSIIRHEIEVVHPVTLSTDRIVRALEDVAFEVDCVISDAGEGAKEANTAEALVVARPSLRPNYISQNAMPVVRSLMWYQRPRLLLYGRGQSPTRGSIVAHMIVRQKKILSCRLRTTTSSTLGCE
jgi:hypothetical protein